MEILKASSEEIVLQLSDLEGRWFKKLLRSYPFVPQDRYKITLGSTPEELADAQLLLTDAIAEQKRENKTAIARFMAEPARFSKAEPGNLLHLSTAEADWLLEIVNEIRVGCWVKLGSPDPRKGVDAKIDAASASLVVLMEGCAYFQSVLLKALDTR